MKLRQKLAMVLAAAMITTAVPVVTMAATTASIDTPSIRIGSEMGYTLDSNGKVNTITTSKALQIYFEANKNYTNQTFSITGTDVEFNEEVYKDARATGNFDITEATGVTVRRTGKDQVEVTVANTMGAEHEFTLPLFLEVTGDAPSLQINGNDGISGQKISLVSDGAEITKQAFTVTFGDKKKISVDGEGTIANINLTETVKGGLAATTYYEVVLEKGSDLEFNMNSPVKVTGKDGFYNKTINAEILPIKGEDDDIFILKVDGEQGALKGKMEISGIQVQSTDRKNDVPLGEVEVRVTQVDEPTYVNASQTEVENYEDTKDGVEADGVVAEVADFGCGLTIKEDDVVDLVAGQEAKEVKVKFTENTIGSFNDNRTIYFSLEGGDFVIGKTKGANDDKYDIEDVQDAITVVDDKAFVTDFVEKDGKVTEVGVSFHKGDVSKYEDNKINSFELKFKVKANLGSEEKVVLEAQSRGMEEDLEVTIADVETAVKVTGETIALQPGMKDQVSGEIVIEETKAEMLERGKQVVVEFVDTADSNMKLVDVEVDTTGDLKVSKKIFNGEDNAYLVLTVDSESDEAATLTVSNIEMTVSNATPNGKYDVKVGGTALDDANHKVDFDIADDSDKAADDEFKDSTKNDVELADLLTVGVGVDSEAVEAVIDLADGTTTVNGEEVDLLTKPFISAAGRTLVGVRDIATIFNIADEDITFADGVVTIVNGDDIIQLTSGSNILKKNGMDIIMDDTMQIVDSRSYAPARFIAIALGLQVDFADGVATFHN